MESNLPGCVCEVLPECLQKTNGDSISFLLVMLCLIKVSIFVYFQEGFQTALRGTCLTSTCYSHYGKNFMN